MNNDMARFREYKNGIFGHKHNGYYILRSGGKGKLKDKEKRIFSIADASGNVIHENINEFSDAEWMIDKMTASEEELKIMKSLYEMEIYQLSSLFVELMEKEEKDDQSKMLYKWVDKVRNRKADEKEF